MGRVPRRKRGTTRRVAAALRAVAPGGRRSRGLGGPTRGPTERLFAGLTAGARRVRGTSGDRRRGRPGSRSLGGRHGRSGDRTDELAAAASDVAYDNAFDYFLLVVGLRLALSGFLITFVSSNLLVVGLVNFLLFGPLAYRHLAAGNSDRPRRRPRRSRASPLARLRARLSGGPSVERL